MRIKKESLHKTDTSTRHSVMTIVRYTKLFL